MFNPTLDVLKEVGEERARQDDRFGEQNYIPALWLSILTEEVGEVAKEIQEMEFCGQTSQNYRRELVQVAAVAVAMVESLDRNPID